MSLLKKMGGGLLITAVLVGSISGMMKVWAEEVPEYRILASPAKLDLELTPGKDTTEKFYLRNTGSKEFVYELSVAPYSVSEGEYKQDLSTKTNYNYITDWVKFSQDSGKLGPDDKVEIEVKVTVPEDAPAGGQYATILAQMRPDMQGNDGSGVSVYSEVGIIVYSKNVEGNTRLTGSVAENKVPGFIFAPPIKATAVVENTGNVHMTATYIMQVFPLFGDEEVYTNEDDPEMHTIMPETKRLNTMVWDDSPRLGIFRVKQTVSFLDETSVTEKIVFICPIWFLMVVLILVFLMVYWIVSRMMRRRRA